MQKALKSLSGLLFILAAFCMSGIALADTPTSTPTWTPTVTRTSTASPTRTATKTITKTSTNSPTRTNSPTGTKTSTQTPSSTPTKSPTPTNSPTPTVTKTPRPISPTTTPTPPDGTNTSSPTVTKTATKSSSPTPTASPTNLDTATATKTFRDTATASPTPLAGTSTPTVGTVIAPNQASALPRVRTDTHEQIFSSRPVDANGNTVPAGGSEDPINVVVDGTSDTIGVFTQGPNADGGQIWYVSDSTTAALVVAAIEAIPTPAPVDMSSVTITGWGDGAVAPAQGFGVNFSFDPSLNAPLVNSATLLQNASGGYFDVPSFTPSGDFNAADANQALWGEVAVAPAQDLFSAAVFGIPDPTDGSFKGPVVGSVMLGATTDGATLLGATVDSDTTLASAGSIPALGVSASLRVDGNLIDANQDNAPGWMPSAIGGVYSDNTTYAVTIVNSNDPFSDAGNQISVSSDNKGWGGIGLAAARYALDGDTWTYSDTMPGVASLLMVDNGSGTSTLLTAYDQGQGNGLLATNIQMDTQGGAIGSTGDSGEGAGGNRLKVEAQSVALNHSDTYTTTGNGATQTFTAQNYTWQIRSDDPISIGLAVTVILENSIDGGTSWQTLDTKTVLDITSDPTTVSAKPGSQFRTRCSVLTLGATATDVIASVLAE